MGPLKRRLEKNTKKTHDDLPGGFNPFEKYAHWIISPNKGEHQKTFELPHFLEDGPKKTVLKLRLTKTKTPIFMAS